MWFQHSNIHFVFTSTTQFFRCTPGEQQMCQVYFMSLIFILFILYLLYSPFFFFFFFSEPVVLLCISIVVSTIGYLLFGELQHKFSNEPKEVIDCDTIATPRSLQITFLKTESGFLKNKLLSGNKLCGIHAEESKKIQAQLKEFHYGKKDLIFKAQQLTDLEQKLSVAKDKLENAALDKESQLKALKETVQLCLSSVLRNQPPTMNLISSKPPEKLNSSNTKSSKVPFQVTTGNRTCVKQSHTGFSPSDLGKHKKESKQSLVKDNNLQVLFSQGVMFHLTNNGDVYL
uniref:Uncharacterized protein n=1 Tax=Cyanistes caeruleus TaxID=156563 RepID=A0A8C0UK96_CYACU